MKIHTGRRAITVLLVALFALFGLGACGDDDDSGSAADSKVRTLLAGLNDQDDPTIAVTEFLPEAITVSTGTTVEWRIAGPEPHSVTFLPPGQELPPPGDETYFPPTLPTGPYDGTTLANSGLVPLGPDAAAPFRVEFAKAGQYSYACVIHPNMTGSVTVTSGEGDTQDEINARADAELPKWLAEGRAAKAKLEETAPATARNANGSTTWKFAMGATTEHTDVLAFAPASGEVRPGDSVTFVNDSAAPHTATFAGGTDIQALNPTDPAALEPSPGPSPQTLKPTGLFNSGILPPNAPPGAGPPEAARSYTYVIPAAGTYNYVCIFHAPSAMTGSIKVA